MTPYTDEQKADLAKRIEARAKAYEDNADYHEADILTDLAAEIRDGSFFEVQHD